MTEQTLDNFDNTDDPTQKTISDLAFHLWQARGCPMGSPEIDWSEAVRQVRGVQTAAADVEARASPKKRPKR